MLREKSGLMHKGWNARASALISFFNQIVILALGLVIPRLVMVSYGSEVNGLITTVSQIFTYVALLEAGIGNAAVNALYKPIVNNDIDSICDVYSAAQKYFRKITLLYLGCVIVLSVGYPFAVKSDLGYQTIALVVFLQGMSGVVNFYFSAAYKQLLIADGKYYIISTINLIAYVLSTLGKIILMNLGFAITLVMFLNFAVNCLQIVCFIFIIRRHYPYLNTVQSPNMSALNERKAFVVHEVSATIFSSTDALVLSSFCNLKITSVYAVYNMIFSSLSSLINAVNNSVNYVLGHVWAKGDKDKYCQTHDTYETVYIAGVFAVFTVAYVMILPFVSLYTAGVSDIQYVDILLPVLFVLIQLLSCSRAVASRLITVSGYAKETQNRSIIEAGINLISSIILVNIIGVYGVLFGTIIALLYRTNDIIIYANRKILGRSPWATYKKMMVNICVFCIAAITEHCMNDWIMKNCNGYLTFVVFGACFMLISAVLYATASIITDKSIRQLLRKKMFGSKGL